MLVLTCGRCSSTACAWRTRHVLGMPYPYGHALVTTARGCRTASQRTRWCKEVTVYSCDEYVDIHPVLVDEEDEDVETGMVRDMPTMDAETLEARTRPIRPVKYEAWSRSSGEPMPVITAGEALAGMPIGMTAFGLHDPSALWKRTIW